MKGYFKMEFYDFLEIAMVLSFGASWPLNARKAYKAKTTKGTSLAFLLLILFGYVCGIVSKFMNPSYMEMFAEKWYTVVFYILNFIVVSVNLAIYFRNKNLDARRARGEIQ